jgi:GMP synthase-like glutamine amidotransferase
MILIVDLNQEKGSLGRYEFVKPLITIVEKEKMDWIARHFEELTAKDVLSASKIILSGTPLMDNGFVEKIALFEWLRDFERPVIGICAGMQAIGLVFGSKLKKCREIGMVKIVPRAKNPLISDDLSAYALHNYAIEPSDRFEVLAGSEKCAHLIKHKDKKIYGVLFHPEVRNPDVLERFLRM